MTTAGPDPVPPEAAPGDPAREAPGRITGLRRFGALSFFYFACIGLFNPYAPLWFQSLGLSTLVIGTIASLQSWTRIIAPYGWAWLGDHGGRRVELIRIAAAGCVLSALGFFGVPYLQATAAAVSVVTLLLFLCNGAIVPLYEATLAHLLARGGPGGGIDAARYGRVRVWGSIGFITSVTAGGVVLDWAGIGAFPIVIAAMNGLMLLAALRLPSTRAVARSDEPAPSVLSRLREPRVAWFFASIFFTVLAHTSLYAFFSLYLDSLGYGKSAVGALWAVAVAVEIVFFWTQGRWASALPPERWLQVVALVTAGRFALIASAGAWPIALVVAQMSHVVTFAAHHAACIALVHRHFPERLRGRGQALYTVLGYGLPGVLGGVGGGWLIGQLGFTAVFWAASTAGLAAWICARRAAG